MNIINDFKPYNKFLLALLVAVINVIVQFYGTNQYVQTAVPFLTALGVFAVPNKGTI